MDVFLCELIIFSSLLVAHTIKYSALGDAKYSPQTDDCGYIAPFSVRLMPICLRFSSLSMLNISFWSGSDG